MISARQAVMNLFWASSSGNDPSPRYTLTTDSIEAILAASIRRPASGSSGCQREIGEIIRPFQVPAYILTYLAWTSTNPEDLTISSRNSPVTNTLLSRSFCRSICQYYLSAESNRGTETLRTGESCGSDSSSHWMPFPYSPHWTQPVPGFRTRYTSFI
jgi:hypothetical protein